MNLKGTHTLPISREQLWTLLMDPDFLAKVTPGVTRLESTGEDSYEAIAEIKMGPVKGAFSGDLKVKDKEEPASFVLEVSQKSKIGNVSAIINLGLEAMDEQQTSLSFDGKAKLSGLLARMGQRVLSGVASTLTKQFFAALEEEVSSDSHQA